jgi:hypothetical protein
MSFFGKLFGSTKAESIALIEIGSDSIAGGFAYFKKGELPQLVYASRADIRPNQGEGMPQAVARTLKECGERFIREGIPMLVRASASGKIRAVLVSVKAPWQETAIRSEKIERTKPFPFTRAMLETAIQKSAEAPQGRLLADEFVVATMLDGYNIKEPVGKKASRISIIVLSSFIDHPLSVAIAQVLRGLFHTESIRLVAASAIRYEALRMLCAHEEDYLTIDITGDSLATTLIRHGILSAVEHASMPQEEEKGWLPALTKTLEGITKRYPLPRKALLVANEGERIAWKQKIEGAELSSLRLSEEPLIVVPVASSHFTKTIRLAPQVEPDLGLMLMTLFWQRRP